MNEQFVLVGDSTIINARHISQVERTANVTTIYMVDTAAEPIYLSGVDAARVWEWARRNAVRPQAEPSYAGFAR